MKKSVTLIVLAIYVLSIAFVGFFGMQISFFEERVYASEVICINEDVVISNNVKRIILTFEPNEFGEMKYQLAWRVLPDITTNKEVKFYFTSNGRFTVDDTGVVTFLSNTMATIQIVTQDGSNKREEVQFYVKKA